MITTLCWLTLCTIDDTAEHVLLVVCICVSASVCVCWGCMLAMSTSSTGPLYAGPLYGVIYKCKIDPYLANSSSVIHVKGVTEK